MYNDNYKKIAKLLSQEFSLELPATLFEQLRSYHALVSTWNISAKLVSASDLESRLWDHTFDSLALLPYFSGEISDNSTYIDVGTGGGFPAIPLILCRPDVTTVLIERSQTKGDFLRVAVRRLGLNQASVVASEFSACSLPPSPRIFTSRAVEKPESISAEIMSAMTHDDIYLCQLAPDRIAQMPGFDQRPMRDTFTEQGWRRGQLTRITKN